MMEEYGVFYGCLRGLRVITGGEFQEYSKFTKTPQKNQKSPKEIQK